MKDDETRQAVFRRDNYRCRYCGIDKEPQAHHIISKEEQRMMDCDDPTLSKMLDQPEYRITLCREHHTLTFFNSAVHYLYSVEEKREQRDIDKQVRELSKSRKELQRSWSNQTDINLYQNKKQQIGDKLKKLENRKMGIVRQGKNRASTIRQQVINTCDKHLLDVEMKRHEGLDSSPGK